jgi:hypothetical protein
MKERITYLKFMDALMDCVERDCAAPGPADFAGPRLISDFKASLEIDARL